MYVSMKEGDYMYYKICVYCGASLDPGKKCDCRKSAEFYNDIRKARFVKATTPTKHA